MVVFNSAVTLPTSSGSGEKVTSSAASAGAASSVGEKPLPCSQRDQLQRVDGGEQLLELVGELRVVLQVHAAGEHRVDGRVEVLPGGVQPVGVVVGHAGLVAGLGLVDDRLYALCMLCGEDLGLRFGLLRCRL